MFGNNLIQSVNCMYSLFFKQLTLKNQNILFKCFVRGLPKAIAGVTHSTDRILSNKSKVIVNEANNSNKYVYRTHTCGELRLENAGEKVVLCGWLHYSRLKKFVILRDGYGQTQLIIKDNDLAQQKFISTLAYESILKVEGEVVPRPHNMINVEQETGAIEVLVNKIDLLNKATDNLPFNIRDYQKAKEHLRMQFRYLDLRFLQMQFNLRTRSAILMKMREFLISTKFIEVETPTLFKATPGGAQEFVVPTRFAGQFYSLVQSPQQFKQMLMAGAIDKYFQIARCYRDEGSRPDRQPEFTQLDIELSFTSVNDVIKIIEDLLQYSWPDFLEPISIPFKRMTYQCAMEKYGTDKPDIRFDWELQDATEILHPININNQANFYAASIIIKKQFEYTGRIKRKLDLISKDYGNVKFLQSKVKNRQEWIQKMDVVLGEGVALSFSNIYNITDGDIIFLAYGPKLETLTLLGRVRLEYINLLEENGNKIRKEGMHLIWITDFPLFELNNATGNLQTVHHPFTSPQPDDLNLLETQPLNVKSLAYDLVLNGNEIAGGSIRIHDPILQEKIFLLLNINKKNLQHILDMLSYGCPPHGGIALGLDRLLSIVLRTQSIRDVIAFPKTFEGRDPISGAPSEISEKEKNIYHINVVP